MLPYETILLQWSHNARIATVTMNRPDVHNALNTRLLDDLKTAFDELSRGDMLCGVVLTGAGKSFSAGADLAMMQAAAHATQEQNQEEALQLASTFEFINSFPIPVVARVNGAAMGGGLGLLAVSDIVIAVDSARLAFSEVKLGIAPAVISPYVVRKNRRVLGTQALRDRRALYANPGSQYWPGSYCGNAGGPRRGGGG